ncbi:shikimate dehydrogenase [Sphingomonas vulcanisoli]|uniref:Shikimate dehydrogenase (NADP(+)) n=1 Tax=Sphingomonas vulcanisoli TaxID=1658060 RepID=A0ABX0TPF0_9SPHN|nr:shikimate dehydrogenase [Sphingomonas vulcanisoli]
MTEPYAEVIGDPIAHSKSPLIHRFWLDRLGIGGDYRKTHVFPDQLAAFLAERRADPDWRGCNVTIPHKLAVMSHLDVIDPIAAKIGAVNTIVAPPEGLFGTNTDAAGFLEPLRPRLAEQHLLRTARIFGTGGAARAVAHALWDEGFTLILIARDLTKAEALAGEFAAGHVHAAALASFADPLAFDWKDTEGRLDLVVNATSLGMTGQPPLPLDFSDVPPGAIVYDAVYAPLETPLLAEARGRGHPTIDGLAMLIGQARRAFELFFGQPAPADPESDAALRALLTA